MHTFVGPISPINSGNGVRLFQFKVDFRLKQTCFWFLVGVWNRRSTFKSVYIYIENSKMHELNLTFALFAIGIMLTPFMGWAAESSETEEPKGDGEIKIYKRLIPADVLRGKSGLSLSVCVCVCS